MIAQTIVDHGLASYYKNRSEAAVHPDTLTQIIPDELLLLDRAELQENFVTSMAETLTTCLLIEGINCAACGWLIEKRLRAMPGILEADLNASTHRLHVRWHGATLALSQIVTKLREIGYTAHPYRADQAVTQIQAHNRRTLRQLGVAGLLWMQVMMASMATWPEFNLDLSQDMDQILRWTSLFLTTPIVFYACSDFFRGAWRDLQTRHLTMDVSVSLAIGGAYLAGIWATITQSGELYFDAVGMFALFLLAGRYLERRAREKTASATSQLIKLLPTSCLRHNSSGTSERILVRELALEDQVLVPPGALIPADGTIQEGYSSIDESLLTGESTPLDRGPGSLVSAGTLNIQNPLIIQVQALGEQTALSAIVRLMERAEREKPLWAARADRAAQWFLLLVLISTVVIGGLWWYIDADRAFWIVIALLVATCPCALSLATPVALTVATGSLRRQGMLITRGHVLEHLETIDTVIFDKTGTLTEGRVRLTDVQLLGTLSRTECLALAGALEQHSAHPIAKAFNHLAQNAKAVSYSPGLGLEGRIADQLVRIGQPAFVAQLSQQSPPSPPAQPGQWLLLGDTKQLLAWLLLQDNLRQEAPDLVRACQARGWNTLLLSGDSSTMVGIIAKTLGIQDARAGLSSAEKLSVVQELQKSGKRILMLGDGINDVPVLAGADISIAMGSASDLAKVNADAVLLSNNLSSVLTTFKIARATRRVIVQNLLWASLYNACILPFAALGWITPLWAALSMSLSSLLVVFNALRLARIPDAIGPTA